MESPVLTTREMHTGGEPVRIVESGYPPIPGATILDKRRYARDHLDHLRTMLMHEPRGHAAMYGVIPVAPDLAEAAAAVLFIHNEGYSTMCGHATIALGRYAVDQGWVEAVEPVTTFVLQCPCGPVTVHVDVNAGQTAEVRFESVPAFAQALDRNVVVAGTRVNYDLGYGGAFYAVASASQFGLDVGRSAMGDLAAAGQALSEAVRATVDLAHPEENDLAFLYGAILTDGLEGGEPSTNVCVFAGSQVDRSPTGSGVTARMAIRHARGLAQPRRKYTFSSITGATMTGRVVREASDGSSVVVEVGGRSYYTGRSTFSLEEADPLARGFTLG